MSEAKQIDLSVLIASHNRRELLGRCLKSLAAQTQDPATFEVIVADDGSSDGTAEMAEASRRLSSCGCCASRRAESRRRSTARSRRPRGASASSSTTTSWPRRSWSPPTSLPTANSHGRLASASSCNRQPETETGSATAYSDAWNERYDGLAGKQPDWADSYGGNFSAPQRRPARDRRLRGGPDGDRGHRARLPPLYRDRLPAPLPAAGRRRPRRREEPREGAGRHAPLRHLLCRVLRATPAGPPEAARLVPRDDAARGDAAAPAAGAADSTAGCSPRSERRSPAPAARRSGSASSPATASGSAPARR